MKRPRRVLVSPSPHICPVCHRTDIRLRQSGILFPHSPGPQAKFGMIRAECGATDFKVCRGSGMQPGKAGETATLEVAQ